MNNYIYEYYQKLKDGSIVSSSWIVKEFEILIKGLENQSFFFDQKKANRAINFIENFCHHHEGELAPNLVKLELWQKAIVSCIFGIVDKDGYRQFREIVLIVGRKNGKTLFAASIAEYCMYMDGEYGARIFFAATKLKQASICFDAFYQMVKKEPELDGMTRKRRTDIYVEETNSSAETLAFSAKRSDGLNVSLCVADEIASWDGDNGLKFYDVIRSSFGSRKQPLLLSISTAGYGNDGVFDEMIKRSTSMINGDSRETKLLPFLYMIDDVEKWNDINELRKSNPNIGVSVSVDYLLEEIAIAEGSLSKKAEFLTKYCNIKQNSSTAWLNLNDINKCFGREVTLDDLRDSYCVGGIDLSQTTDLTACTIVVEKNGKLNVFVQFFMPSEKVDEATARDGIPYYSYVHRGMLKLSGDNFIDYRDVFKFFVSLVEEYRIYPLKVGYDRYSAQYLVQDMKSYGFHMDDCWQGENMTPVINEVEGMVRDGSFNFGNNDLMKIHLANSAIKLNSETKRCKLIKIASNYRIDGTAALLDAMAVRQKYSSEVGEQLKNEV